MSRKRQSHSCSDRVVRDECRAPPFGMGRYRAAPSAAGRRLHGPSAEGTGSDERGRYRPLRADVLSCSSVTSLGSSNDVDGQVIKWTRRGVQPGFGDVQIACGGLEVAVAEQQLDAAQIGTGIQQMGGEAVAQHMWAQRLGDA